MFNSTEQRATLALLIHAALADGSKSDAERSALRRMTESFAASGPDAVNPWAIYQDVLGGRYPVAAAVADLQRPEARLMAYEMALGVCDTDGPPNAAEEKFLHDLRQSLQIAGGAAGSSEKSASQIAQAAVPASTPGMAAVAPAQASVDTSALEKSILNYSILNAALELLPQNLATMAVVPLQMKMVYGVGKAHGYTLDRGHIRDFLATAGAGLAAQAVEGYARKLLGGLVGKALGGGIMGGLGRAAISTTTGAGITFAATYAIGHLALRYYGGGRKMETAVLKDTYQRLLGDGRRLFGLHSAEVERRAATLSPSEVINLVRQP